MGSLLELTVLCLVFVASKVNSKLYRSRFASFFVVDFLGRIVSRNGIWLGFLGLEEFRVLVKVVKTFF